MKTRYFLFLSAMMVTVYSCNQGPKHPQANLIKQSAATAATDQSIRYYADSIDANLKSLEKQTSLVYLKSDQSMYVEKYSWNGKSVLYKESGENGGIQNYTKIYYFRNDSLVLVKENKESIKGGTPSFSETNTFLRNNIAFKKENRTAANTDALAKEPYLSVSDNKTTSTGDSDYQQQINLMEDAIKGVNQYEMRFNQIISVPEENIIQLKAKAQNGYTANVLVKESDSFIDSLVKNPSIFKNQKLKFNWKIEDKEAVYVPVAAKVTSAKGLKR